MIYFEEFSARDVPRSAEPAGPVDRARRRSSTTAPTSRRSAGRCPTLRGEIAWCLGMSEPSAGSDLAGRCDPGRRSTATSSSINGQKVWTSGAHHADWCLCFVRTDPEAPKHKGISALIIDMSTPGSRAARSPS